MADNQAEAEPVRFGQRLAGSQAFSGLLREGRALFEEPAAYLDAPGGNESKQLERGAALAYATESMRLTTRLMQLASWLLLHRAVNEGEMSLAQASREKAKVKLAAGDPRDEATLALLPRTCPGWSAPRIGFQNAIRRPRSTFLSPLTRNPPPNRVEHHSGCLKPR